MSPVTLRKVPKAVRGPDLPQVSSGRLRNPARGSGRLGNPARAPGRLRNPARFDVCWLLVWFVFGSVWCLAAARELSATFDEPFYVKFGLEHWRTGHCHGLTRLGTMPLPVDVATLPLYVAERWRGIPFDRVNDLEDLLPWARAGNLVFFGLLLFYGWRAGRALAGPWGGRLAVALLACEPTILAHAGLATTDIAVSACLLALLYYYRAAREPGATAGRFRRFVVPAFWFAAAVLSKASGLVFGPLCLLVVELEGLCGFWGIFPHPLYLANARSEAQAPRLADRVVFFWGKGFNSGKLPLIDRTRISDDERADGLPASLVSFPYLRAFRQSLLEMAAIVGGGLVLVCLYCGSSDGSAKARFLAHIDRLPDGPVRSLVRPVAEYMPLFNNAADGIWFQVKHNAEGHYGTFLLGNWHADRALWYYFPVALAIKLPLPLLVLPLLLALLLPRSLMSWPCLAAAALLVFSVSCRVQIGIRYMLPLIALAVVGLAVACVVVSRRYPLFRFVAPLAVLWSLTSAIAVWPHGLCYANELWGGTERGYLHLSDSNYDWGQGVKELHRWQRAHGIARLDLWYFGSDPALRRLPMRWLHLEDVPVHEPGGMLDLLRGRYLAVSTTVLYGHPCSESPAAAFLRSRQPVDRTSTFLIYYFP